MSFPIEFRCPSLTSKAWVFLLALLATVTLIPSALAQEAVQGAEDKIYGYDLDKVAKATAIYSTIQATYGHEEVDAQFAVAMKKEMGSSPAEYSSAYNAWNERFQKDPSGRLEARFHTLLAKHMQEANFADVPDQSQDTREGVSLDTFAKIVVLISRQPGTDLDTVAKQNGLEGKEHFDRVNQAWTQAMAEDTSFALTQQYGALYQKHAGSGYAAEQEEKLANLLAERNDEEDPYEEEAPPTAADYARDMKSEVASDRWYASRQLAFQCTRFKDWGDDAGEGLEQHCNQKAMVQNLLPVISELLRDYGDSDVGLASGILRLVLELELGDALGRSKVETALTKARQRLAEVQAEFEPIQHQAVPQKRVLRNTLDVYRTAVEEFEEHLEDW